MIDWGKNKFGVEHALGMYAYSYAILPAAGIYDQDKILHRLSGVPENSHIYIIGETPTVSLKSVKQLDRTLEFSLYYLEKTHAVSLPLSDSINLANENGAYFLTDQTGTKYSFDIVQVLNAAGDLPFKVLYIGQAFGENGERKALDRLVSHTRLQEIALKGASEDHELYIILIELADNMLITHFNPFAENYGDDVAKARISSGVGKLYETSLAERVSLYEAALIRYFQPDYNIEFKNSFPSTNLKVLEDLYDKDFAAVVAEFCFDEFPYQLFTDKIEKKSSHIAHFELNSDDDRKFFFGSAI